MLAADGPRLDLLGDGIPLASGGNGIALGVVCAWLVIRDAERRADPTDEYDQIAVAVVIVALLLLPLVVDFASVWAGLAGGAGRRRLRAALGARSGGRLRRCALSKFTPLSDELHGYMVEHGARQDEVLRRVQEETAAMGEISVMQIAPDQGAFMTLLAKLDRGRRGDRARHLHRLLGDLHRPRPRPGRAADRLRALRGVRGDRRAQPRGRRGRRPGRDPDRAGARDARGAARAPRPSTSASSTPTRRATRTTTRRSSPAPAPAA